MLSRKNNDGEDKKRNHCKCLKNEETTLCIFAYSKKAIHKRKKRSRVYGAIVGFQTEKGLSHAREKKTNIAIVAQ